MSSARADRLVELLAERELDSLLVTNLLNVRYLTGFTGTNGACVVTPDERLFFTDFRYVEQAREQVPDFERIEAGRDMLGDLAKRLRGRAGFDDDDLSVAAHRKLGEKVPDGVELVPAGGLVERLRAVKDEAEAAAMAAAAEISTAAYHSLRERGLAGRTEREVAWGSPASWRTRAPRGRRSRRSWRRGPTARCRTRCRATSRSRATRSW